MKPLLEQSNGSAVLNGFERGLCGKSLGLSAAWTDIVFGANGRVVTAIVACLDVS